jgi:hypothetical protein
VAAQLKRTLEALSRGLAAVVQGEPLRMDYLLYCPDYVVKQPGDRGAAAGAHRRRQPARRTRCARGSPRRFRTSRRATRWRSAAPLLRRRAAAGAGRLARWSAAPSSWSRASAAASPPGRAGWSSSRSACGWSAPPARARRSLRSSCWPMRPRRVGARCTSATTGRWPITHAQLAPHDRGGGDLPPAVRPAPARRRRATDFRQPGAFERLAERMAALPVRPGDEVDELVIDEGQDFDQAWVRPCWRACAAAGAPGGSRIPCRTCTGGPRWTARLPCCVRTPTIAVRAIVLTRSRGSLQPAERPERPARSRRRRGLPDLRDAKMLLDATTRAITLALKAGFRREDIAIVTFTGRERSALRAFDQIGPHRCGGRRAATTCSAARSTPTATCCSKPCTASRASRRPA